MSLITVSARVAELTEFMKEKTLSNLLESARRGDIDIDKDTLAKVNRIVDLSISQAFTLGYGNVESALVEFQKTNK